MMSTRSVSNSPFRKNSNAASGQGAVQIQPSRKATNDSNVGSPFLHNIRSPSQFCPVRLEKRMNSDSTVPKPPKAPEKPHQPYMRYHKKVFDQVKDAHKGVKLWEITKIIGQMWRDLPEDEKKEVVDEYDNEKLQYNEALRVYHNSPAYQNFIQAKMAAEQEAAAHKSIEEEGEKASKQMRLEGAGIYTIDEDDDAANNFSVKHVAAIRFQRNQRLMADLLNEVSVPDVAIIVNQQRMTVLKKQVGNVELHQKKLEAELSSLKEKHKARCQSMTESRLSWQTEMNKLMSEAPKITAECFQDFYNSALREYEEAYAAEQKKKQIITEEKEKMEKTPVESGFSAFPVSMDASPPCLTQQHTPVSSPGSGNISLQPTANDGTTAKSNADQNTLAETPTSEATLEASSH